MTSGPGPLRRGAFPGTFNPPTVAHVAIADAARVAHRLERIDLIVSRVPLAKTVPERPTLDERVAVLEALGARLGWLGVVVSDLRLVADLAEGYDVVIVGADKWAQLHDVDFYRDEADRDAALARLPTVAVVPRAGHHAPAAPSELHLPVDPEHLDVSSTRARTGEHHLMVLEARDSGLWT